MAITISVRADIRALQRNLTGFMRQQVPFATAVALTNVGKLVVAAEKAQLARALDNPTPFTRNAVGVRAARKTDLRAVVYMRDIAASYLEPFEFGGNHKLPGNGRTWLNPKERALLNQYGNLSRNKLAQLKARPDVFIGKIKTKRGEEIHGVWQRPTKKVRGRSRKGANDTGRMKLLIRFGDARPVNIRLGYRDLAQRVIDANLSREWQAALAQAQRTARR